MSAQQIHTGRDRTVRFLHTDAIPPSTLAGAQVARAFAIEWDAAAARWAVRITLPGQPSPDTVFTHELRHVCVQWEVQFVNGILRSLD
jgi:hypothetical protein